MECTYRVSRLMQSIDEEHFIQKCAAGSCYKREALHSVNTSVDHACVQAADLANLVNLTRAD